jgi:hypothetical protein
MLEPRWRRRVLSLLPIALATAWLAHDAIGGVMLRLGHPGATLDDSFIHFQYARAFAEGHPFRYQAGDPPTSGATSLLWPLLLAPFYAIGFRDLSILWPAWGLSFLALGLLAHEAFLLARRLAGTACAVGAGAMVLSLSAFTWCAASGMEIVPFAFCLARATRRASEWAEGLRPRPSVAELVAMAFIAPLFRPEGAVAAVMIGVTLFVFPPERSVRGFGAALLAMAAALVPVVLSFLLTGSFASSTATVKLLLGNPYFAGPALTAELTRNLRILFGTLLDGDQWSAEFIPNGGAALLVAGLLALLVCGQRAQARWRAVCVLTLALTMCAPCAYVSFLWNRLRYLWPFATGWLVGLACLARLLGDALGTIRPRARVAAPLLCGAFSGALFIHKSSAIEDVADSASGIERQQVTLGRWAKRNLAPDARIGVNDTGAIAYLSDRRTFDIVGLTTRDEGRYWVAGPGSRFEHYERLYDKSPASLPTHFIVYPEWMACDAVLGRPLYEATVLDSTILGGRTMRAYEADYSLLGSGEHPWTANLSVFDSLDVADLESEATHDYELLGALDGEEIVAAWPAPDERIVADGGRTNRTRERFVVDSPRDVPSIVTVRAATTTPTRMHIFGDGSETGTFDIEQPAGEAKWREYTFPLPRRGRQTVELRVETGTIAVFHYWFSYGPLPFARYERRGLTER